MSRDALPSACDCLPLDREAKVLEAHPAGLVALDKPAGVRTHPNRKNELGTRPLLRAEYDADAERYLWTDDNGHHRHLYLVHRLDSPTSGVLLACTDPSLAETLRKAFSRRDTQKTYYAIVREKAKVREGLWNDRLSEKREGGKLRVKPGKGLEALAKATFERRRCGRFSLSLLRLEPHTGRTHQLRVQTATRGLPILGDGTYGDFAFNRKIARASRVERLCLHASSIEVALSHRGEELRFTAESPLPRAFGKLLS